jgi:hypothetical protein
MPSPEQKPVQRSHVLRYVDGNVGHFTRQNVVESGPAARQLARWGVAKIRCSPGQSVVHLPKETVKEGVCEVLPG